MATYCPINEAYTINGAVEIVKPEVEEPHFFQELPFISANGKLITSKKPKPIIEPFANSSRCTHLLTCPQCRKLLSKYKNSYQKILKAVLIGIILILIVDLFD